ncbi:hypothetical protein ACMCDV_000390 [Campylobacter jejuni]|uniref:hypothetical protein n=1 Tax=Campylobacter jejuni TaxID=197 RepID=UPI000A89C63F|nr:hypothetical protein [Campylobacter jejuni]
MKKDKQERISNLYEKTKELNLEGEVHILVNNIKWGKKANILINCTDLKSNIEFYFSVFLIITILVEVEILTLENTWRNIFCIRDI